MLKRIEYNRKAAVSYAEMWAKARNPKYYDFADIGGNCTNFVSQCTFAACGVMNYTPVYGWYYLSINDRSPSWTGVEYFFDFMTENTMQGPFAINTTPENSAPGDVLQLGDGNGDYYHSLEVLSNNGREIYVAANNNDALYRPLSSYYYENIRCIHFLGALAWT